MMGQSMKDYGRIVNQMDILEIFMMMVHIALGSLEITKEMDIISIIGIQVVTMKDSGLIIKDMD